MFTGIELSNRYKDEYEEHYTDYVRLMQERANDERLIEFCALRNYPLSVVKEAGIFYIGNMAELLIPKYLDVIEDFGIISNVNNKPIFNNRWIIPIKTVEERVQNLVGYTYIANERYVYGVSKYYRRRDTLYGLENLEFAYELGWAVLVEGITDVLSLRKIGIKNSFATCGTQKSEFVLKQLNRCRYGVIKIPDRDLVGLKAKNSWKLFKSITLYPQLFYKDIDEMIREGGGNEEAVKEAISFCVEELVKTEHRGVYCLDREVTML